jgi:hypothetical protein
MVTEKVPVVFRAKNMTPVVTVLADVMTSFMFRLPCYPEDNPRFP